MAAATQTTDIKNLELDKICRVCLSTKKEMRPLFEEFVANMLMEFAQIQVGVGENPIYTIFI